MLVCQACVVRSDLPDDPMILDAVRAFRFVVGQTAERGSGVRRNDRSTVRANVHLPLVITMIAHEVDAWKIQLNTACRTLSRVEHLGLVRI